MKVKKHFILSVKPTKMASFTYAFIILPSILILTAIIGNTLVITIWSKKTFKHLDLRSIFCLEAVFEILSVLQLMQKLIDSIFQIELQQLSSFCCKLFITSEFNIPATSAYLLVTISVQRLVVIRAGPKLSIPKKMLLLKVLISITFLYMLPYHILYIYSYDLIEVKNGNFQ